MGAGSPPWLITHSGFPSSFSTWFNVLGACRPWNRPNQFKERYWVSCSFPLDHFPNSPWDKLYLDFALFRMKLTTLALDQKPPKLYPNIKDHFKDFVSNEYFLACLPSPFCLSFSAYLVQWLQCASHCGPLLCSLITSHIEYLPLLTFEKKNYFI